MNHLIPPNKSRIQQALNILEEEGFTEYQKLKLKEQLFQLDLVQVDEAMIGSEVLTARLEAKQLDQFMNQLKEYINE